MAPAASLAAQLTARGVAPAVIQSILQSGSPAPEAQTPPGFNRQTLVAPLIGSAIGAGLPDLVAALRGRLPETSDAPGSKAILSEDLIPRLIEQERARQRWGQFFGLDAGPSAQDVYQQIVEGRSAGLEAMGARERAIAQLKGNIDIALRKLEQIGQTQRQEIATTGDIRRQELSSLGDIQRQRVSSSYGAAQQLLNTAIQNLTNPQNLANSSVVQQLAAQVA